VKINKFYTFLQRHNRSNVSTLLVRLCLFDMLTYTLKRCLSVRSDYSSSPYRTENCEELVGVWQRPETVPALDKGLRRSQLWTRRIRCLSFLKGIIITITRWLFGVIQWKNKLFFMKKLNQYICIEKVWDNFKKVNNIIKKREKCHICSLRIIMWYCNNRS
jgi:hypothetical protein